ncbi:hypothetical protein CQA66_06545 [Helicobacter aurati]|uniref:Uncharacterized protein n=1 Tax=Helicobacter aurati TaxID=137778 RepID=A0A3D8J297_9HELI|nr:hypothetical protein [Helicobacter aurati]RDU71326.1 hypothetical protein CQA66_06545 [Helicobacter aurati]
MYLLEFYLLFWGISFICVIPTLIVGAIYIIISNKPATNKEEFTIDTMLGIIKNIQNKEAFNAALNQFKSKYKVFNDQKKFDTWINCIKELTNTSYWDTDAIAKFGQELEDANSAHAKNISVAIATVLKTKEKK